MRINLAFLFKILLFINVLTLGIIFRVRSYPAPEADFQTYIKLAVWFVSLSFSLLLWRYWASKMVRIDNVFMSLFILVCCLSALYAPLVYFSLGAAFSLLSVMVFCYACSSILNFEDVLKVVLYALTTICFISVIVYFVNPEFGRLGEWHHGQLTVGKRMSGATGTANALGAISAFGVLLSFYIFYNRLKANYKLIILCLLICAYALIMTHSRTSMLGLIIALSVIPLVRPSLKLLCIYTLGLSLAILMIAIAIFLDSEALAVALSRSGDVEEITSGTGRTSIWAVAIKLIEERFLLGYGYASSLQVFDAHQHDVGFKVASAHNMILQIFMNTGFIGFILFLLATFLKIYTALINGNGLIIGSYTFLMILGLSESVAIQGTANISTFILGLTFSMAYVPSYYSNKTFT